MKLEIKQENIETFKSYIEALDKLSTEMLISFEEDKLTMRVDYSGCVIGQITLKKDFFSIFEGEGTFNVFLSDIVSCTKKIKSVILLETDQGALTISTEKTSFKTPLIADEKEYPNMPELTFDGKVVLTAENYSNMISTISAIKPDTIKLCHEKTRFMAKTQKNQREVSTEVETVELDSIEEQVFIDFDHITKFKTKTTNDIKLFIKKDAPLIISTENENSKLEFMIAPRVEEGY